jgi:hypothetical protein
MANPQANFLSKLVLDMVLSILGLCFLAALASAFFGGSGRLDPTSAAVGMVAILPILGVAVNFIGIASIVFASMGRPGFLIMLVGLVALAYLLNAHNRHVAADARDKENVRLESGRQNIKIFLSQNVSPNYPQLADTRLPIFVSGVGGFYEAGSRSRLLPMARQPLVVLDGRIPDEEHPLQLINWMAGAPCFEDSEIISMLSYAERGAFDQCEKTTPFDLSSDHLVVRAETVLGKSIRPEFDSLNFTEIMVSRIEKGEQKLIFAGANFEGASFPPLQPDYATVGMDYAMRVMAALGLFNPSTAMLPTQDELRLAKVAKNYIFHPDRHIRATARGLYQQALTNLRHSDSAKVSREDLTQEISATASSYFGTGSPEGLMAALNLATLLTAEEQQSYLLDAARAIVRANDRDMGDFANIVVPLCRLLDKYEGQFSEDVRTAAADRLTRSLNSRAQMLTAHILQYGGTKATKCY